VKVLRHSCRVSTTASPLETLERSSGGRSPTLSEAEQDTLRQLTVEEKEAIEGAQKWVDDSAAALGMAYLEYEESKLRYELAAKNLASRAATTRQSEVQRNQVMVKFVEVLELGPGEWVYDGKGKLVKKDKPNAKST